MPSIPYISKIFPNRCCPTLPVSTSSSQQSSVPPNTLTIQKCISAALPCIIWLVMFSCAKYIPDSIRPRISVDVLPFLDDLLFDNPLGLLLFSASLVGIAHAATKITKFKNSDLIIFVVFVPLVLRALRELATVPSSVADVLGFLPYGVFHYSSPVLFSLWVYRTAGVDATVVFLQAFGVQNILGVVTQLIFPCAAPWYNDIYGFAPASYSTPGHPAGLARVDNLFHTHLYTSTFNASPLVFGALPSLHSGFAVLIAIFALHYSNKVGGMLMIYVCWQWWATMYFRHHYMIDLTVGMGFSLSVYALFRGKLEKRVVDMGYKLVEVVVEKPEPEEEELERVRKGRKVVGEEGV